MSIKLSIIIPCYNAEPYIHELLDCLDKQMTDEAEVILIDDGSKVPLKLHKVYPWISHFIRQKNCGISKARNRGLELAKGELINFVDADDMVAPNYVEYVIGKLSVPEWDYMDLSWRSLEDSRYEFLLHNDEMSLPNPSASTRVFKRSFIGDTRFPELKDAAEDEDFTRHLQIRKAKHICATQYMYYYRVSTPGSNYKRYMEGRTKTKRIGYFYKAVTPDMTWLVDEIKETEKIHEVFLYTYDNQIPELEKYANISYPAPCRVAEMRGEPNDFMKLIPCPFETQVLIYKSRINDFGGIETFIYNFVKQMSEKYGVAVLCDDISHTQLQRLAEICPVIKNTHKNPIVCDTLIINSIFDIVPENVEYKQSVQMMHCVKQCGYTVPEKRDIVVHVSQASRNSFGESAKDNLVIHNLTSGEQVKRSLVFVSAFRVGAADKQGNDERCIEFANRLNKLEIPFMWLYFGNKAIDNAPQNMIYCGSRTNILSFVAVADYFVQLSGAEAYSYSILEALECNTPVIVTPLDQNSEMGIIDSENAYIFDFDTNEWTDDEFGRLWNIPKFAYKHDNKGIMAQWREVLGKPKKHDKYEPEKEANVQVIVEYRDMQRDEVMKIGKRCTMTMRRAVELQGLGFVRIL